MLEAMARSEESARLHVGQALAKKHIRISFAFCVYALGSGSVEGVAEEEGQEPPGVDEGKISGSRRVRLSSFPRVLQELGGRGTVRVGSES